METKIAMSKPALNNYFVYFQQPINLYIMNSVKSFKVEQERKSKISRIETDIRKINIYQAKGLASKSDLERLVILENDLKALQDI